MAIKTFTTGEVLTAADTNTYLANSGLVYIKSQTVGSGVSSVNVTAAFSSTYDNYLIQYNGGTKSVASEIGIQLGATTSNYYNQYLYTTWNTTLNIDGGTNAPSFYYAGFGSTIETNMSFTILSPNLAKCTRGFGIAGSGTTYAGWYQAMLDNTTQYTDFTVKSPTGTLTGGTITVYGYRKA